MTQEDFKAWFAHHRACFPGLDSWLGKIDAAAKNRSENPLTSRDVLRTWFKALEDLELADAKEASTKMLKGDAEAPRAFDDHPRAIRKLAYVARSDRRVAGGTRRYHDGERTFCAACGDSGLVIVLHPETEKAIYKGELSCPRYSMGVRCTCSEGSKRHPSVEIVFDKGVHVPCSPCISDEEWAELTGEPLPIQQGQAWAPDVPYEEIIR